MLVHLEGTAVAITTLSNCELIPGRREEVFWVCSEKKHLAGMNGINTAFSSHGWVEPLAGRWHFTKQSQFRERVDTAPGMPFCETEPILAWNGFVRAKTLAYIRLSEILAAEPLARMSPTARFAQNGDVWNFAKQSQSQERAVLRSPYF